MSSPAEPRSNYFPMARRYFLAGILACAAAGILLFPAELSGAVKSSLEGCMEVVIPALFAFTVLAVYMQQSGLYTLALKPLTLPLSKLLGIPEELCAVFVLANIGGYPVGARLLSGLVREGRLSRRDAGRLLCCCYGSGPSFVIGTAGMRVFGSAAAGGIIFAACFLSSLIIAVIVCRTGGKITLESGNARCDLTADCFVRSVDGGARVMYTICIMAALFAAVTALLDCSGISRLVSALLEKLGAGSNSARIFPAFLEVTRVRDMLPGGAAAPVCAGLLSFGGVCVLMQVTAVSGGNVTVKPLVLSRLPAALLSAFFAIPAGYVPAAAQEAYSETAVRGELFSVNAGLSVCVMAMAGMLILSVEKAGRQSG